MPAITTYPLTGDAFIDSLLGGVKWATLDLTYSFPGSASYYGLNYGFGETSNNFGVLHSAQQATARAVFVDFSAVSNVAFTEVTETSTQHGDLRLALSDAPSTAWAYYPSTAEEGGDMWFNKSNGYYDSPRLGNYAFSTFLHETGHALGLEHAHEGNAMPLSRDSLEYTVMSYRSYIGASTTSGYTNGSGSFPQSLMMYDIAALQHLYGANYETNAGNTSYSWSPTTGEMFVNGVGKGAPAANRVFLTVWDGGGTDTYDFSAYSTDLKVDLRPGEWTTTSAEQLAKLHYDGSKIAVGNIANALLHQGDTRSLVENANGGSANDVITGNGAANTLRGNGGNDNLNGGAGTDYAVYSGLSSEYEITKRIDGSHQVQDLRQVSPDGTDITVNIEYFRFGDGIIAADKLPNYFTGDGSWTGAGRGGAGWHVGDFNGDGQEDIFRYVVGKSGADMFLSNGAKFVYDGSWSGAGMGNAGWHLGDFNGDGQEDIFRYIVGTSGADMFLSNGAKFIYDGSWSGAGMGNAGWHLGDFNGDGRDDIFRYVKGKSGAEVFLSNGDTFDFSGSWTGAGNGTFGWSIGDFNGDGRDDLMRAGSGQSVEVFLSSGGTFAFAGSWAAAAIEAKPQTGDFNGDGYDDFLLRSPDATAEVYLSNGSSFTPTGQGAPENAELYTIGDFNGDGADDVSRYIAAYSGADVWFG